MFKKKHCHQLEISTILKAFCAAEKKDGLESQGNTPELGDAVKERSQCCWRIAACSWEVDACVKIQGL